MTVRRFERPLEVADAPERSKPIEVTLSAPEELPKVIPQAKWKSMLPLIMVVGIVGMIVMQARQGSFNMYMLMFPLMILASMGAYIGSSGSGRKAPQNSTKTVRSTCATSATSGPQSPTRNEFGSSTTSFGFPHPSYCPALWARNDSGTTAARTNCRWLSGWVVAGRKQRSRDSRIPKDSKGPKPRQWICSTRWDW